LLNDRTGFEEKQYTDIWNSDEYLQFMYERLVLLHELLADDGSLYVHCDWHQSQYLRCILDEIFGIENFRNDITWVRSTNPKGSQHTSNRYNVFTDTILFYAKSSATELHIGRVRKPLSKEEFETLPVNHNARKNPDIVIKRNSVSLVEMPIFNKIKNKVDVVFNGAEPDLYE